MVNRPQIRELIVHVQTMGRHQMRFIIVWPQLNDM